MKRVFALLCAGALAFGLSGCKIHDVSNEDFAASMGLSAPSGQDSSSESGSGSGSDASSAGSSNSASTPSNASSSSSTSESSSASNTGSDAGEDASNAGSDAAADAGNAGSDASEGASASGGNSGSGSDAASATAFSSSSSSNSSNNSDSDSDTLASNGKNNLGNPLDILNGGLANSSNNSNSSNSANKGKDDALAKELGLTAESKTATEETAQVNSALTHLDFYKDQSESEQAAEGLIAAPESLELRAEDGSVVWSQDAYSFLNDYQQSPNCANPLLWENAKNNHAYGLYQVSQGIYQVRGYDVCNLTLIEGKTGWIVVDPVGSVECAKAAMQLVNDNLEERPVMAVVLSSTDANCYGGILGVVDADQLAGGSGTLSEQLASGKVPVVAASGFAENALGKYRFAAKALVRRGGYSLGSYLDASETGKLSAGSSLGSVSYAAPSYTVAENGESCSIDGVELQFYLGPSSETAGQLNIWLPDQKALWISDSCSNLNSGGGAAMSISPAQRSKMLCQAIANFGSSLEVVFQAHNWPHRGNQAANDYLTDLAASYRFINDQTLTYLNQGYTADEAASMVELPEALANTWYTRQVYGNVSQIVRQVYASAVGSESANPVYLNPLPQGQSAEKWAAYLDLGSTDEALRQAKRDYDKGEYQWVAEFTNTLVQADPENQAARLLCADALEQLGYQAETESWRNSYLSGALELRRGNAAGGEPSGAVQTALAGMDAEDLVSYLGILLDKQALAGDDFVVNVKLSDTNAECALRFKNGAVLMFDGYQAPSPDLSITTTSTALGNVVSGDSQTFAKDSTITGDSKLLDKIFQNLTELDASSASYNVVEP